MTITEVSHKFNITADTLRYYEKIGLVEKVNRNSKGVRDYSESDLRRIEFIKCMRRAGLSIEVLRKYVQLFNEGDETVTARKEILIEQRKLLEKKMEEMQATLDRLDFKIKNYEKFICKKEQEVEV